MVDGGYGRAGQLVMLSVDQGKHQDQDHVTLLLHPMEVPRVQDYLLTNRIAT